MEVQAKISTTLNQVMVFRQSAKGAYRISIADAKHAHNTDKIKKSNAVFKRLVENDFDTRATMQSYKDDAQRIAAEHES